MQLLNKLEKKFGRFAIKNLMLYIVIANAIAYVFLMLDPNSAVYYGLILDPALVLQGEVWRLFTFIFIPPNTHIIFIIFMLYFYYWIGNTLEHYWGAFKFNLYYLIGILSLIIGSFITGYPATNEYLNLSLFLVFAQIFPQTEVNLYFLLPIKMKYLAIIYWIFILIAVVQAPTIGAKSMILLPLVAYFIFFGRDIVSSLFRKNRKRNFQKQTTPTRKTTKKKTKSKANLSVVDNLPKTYSVHKCTICGITEKSNPDMEFRFCSKCTGFHEYCMTHLKDHEHKE